MSSPTSLLLKNLNPESDEIAKAIVLSSLAYLDNGQAKAEFENRYSDIGFARILMAQHFILGFESSTDSDYITTLYVAFRAPLSIQDMFAVKVADRSEFIQSYGEAAEDVDGLFHYELFKKVISELPSMSYFKKFTENRIIFSGHGSAGALAHLFLICYMINTREMDRQHISIGFGSPYFCDDAAKRFCRKTMELDRRMFTFANATDPVPWMLAGIRMTCNPGSLGRTRAETICSDLEILNIWLNSANSDERMEITIPLLKPVLKEMGRIGPFRMPYYESVGVYRQRWGSTRSGTGSMNILWEFALVSLKRSISMIQQPDFRLIVYNGLISMDRALDVDSWECHKVKSYVKEFASNHTNRGGFASKPIIEIAPNPFIHACTLSVYNRETSYEGIITITGSDLSEVCHVELNVGHEWTVQDTSESNCVLSRGFLTELEANAISSWKRDEIVEQPHLSVKLSTCFGSTNADVQVEDLWKDGPVDFALTRCMGRLLLMQQSEVLVNNDEYKEAYETLKSAFLGPVERFSYSRQGTKREQFKFIRSFLTRPVEIPLHTYIIEVDGGQPSNESPERVHKKSDLCLSTSLSSNLKLSSLTIPENASKLIFCHGSYFSISDGRIRILNYRDIVRTIYCLFCNTELQDDQSGVSYYETEIYKFQDLREGQVAKKRQDLPEELQEDIEKRAFVMYKVITASNLLKRLRFAAFIGPENAGKTSLINSILCENVGDVGFTTHTTAVAPYMFRDDIFLVDFPGTDGGGDRAHLSKIWEEYEKVADLCVVVLNFGGDTSLAAQVFPRIARSRMCSNVVLVMNRVDSVLNGSGNSPVWAEYSSERIEQLKISISGISGVPADRVFFSVLRSSEELEETTRQLLKERLIMLKDEITNTVRGLLSGLK